MISVIKIASDFFGKYAWTQEMRLNDSGYYSAITSVNWQCEKEIVDKSALLNMSDEEYVRKKAFEDFVDDLFPEADIGAAVITSKDLYSLLDSCEEAAKNGDASDVCKIVKRFIFQALYARHQFSKE